MESKLGLYYGHFFKIWPIVDIYYWLHKCGESKISVSDKVDFLLAFYTTRGFRGGRTNFGCW